MQCTFRSFLTPLHPQHTQTKEDEIANLTEALRTRNYRLDLLVLNAGVAEHEHPNVNACQIDRCGGVLNFGHGSWEKGWNG